MKFIALKNSFKWVQLKQIHNLQTAQPHISMQLDERIKLCERLFYRSVQSVVKSVFEEKC